MEELPDLGDESEEDDLNDFNALKSKTEKRAAKRTMGNTGTVTIGETTQMHHTYQSQHYEPKTVEREVVIDDFIRNFLTSLGQTKTMNIFQNEWFELQKKGTFQDLGIGLITDIKNKNARMEAKIDRMTVELK